MKYNSIRPGQVWLDTNGNRIQAHGGSIIYVDGVYYWYGENKEKTTGENKIWHWASAAMHPRTSITGRTKASSSRRNPAIPILP